MRVIHDTEFPNSVDATQKLLDEQGAEYERLKVKANWISISNTSKEFNQSNDRCFCCHLQEEILSAARHGERLLDDFRTREIKEFSERTGNVSTTER